MLANGPSPARDSPAREHWPKPRFSQNACDRLALVTLDFDRAVLHGAAAATRATDLFCELLFFGQPDASEAVDYRDGLASASARFAPDVHATAILHRTDVRLRILRRARFARISI